MMYTYRDTLSRIRFNSHVEATEVETQIAVIFRKISSAILSDVVL